MINPEDLSKILDTAHLVSTDNFGGVGRVWWPVFGWSDEQGARLHREVLPQLTEDERVALVDPADPRISGAPRRWLVHVGAGEQTSVKWLLDGVRQALAAVATTGRRSASKDRPRRVAMPVMGVGGGGFNGRRGRVINGLLGVARKAAAAYAMDVVIVAANPSDYSALQALRNAGHGRSLPAAEEQVAQRLAALARAGQLAIFMGAGTGIAAGLPSWSELLADLARRVGIKQPAQLSTLGPLDAAEVLRRAADRRERDRPASERRSNPLGHLVAEVIGGRSRYALSHAHLAALDADQVITTNFDRLYEKAVREIRKKEPFVVLPETSAAAVDDATRRRPWLLKLHGDVEAPDDIVLDRRSFVRYDAKRRPLGGVLQTTLLTKHLLVVGASMTDDNVIRLIHEVAELNERPGDGCTFGTVLTLRADPMRAKLWEPEFDYVNLGRKSSDMRVAGRELEIFLDRVALLAAPRTAHLLDPRYRELLESPAERELARIFRAAAHDHRDAGRWAAGV
ncbi:SIR2 family NAD-dependent protein deacylase [Trujillonella humicola]|uniref:SIR2 family NAD-dependent protein deacylase n=1 Tax=Trujillonella humicola TaxID=3383699 RepID=UPI00390672EE